MSDALTLAPPHVGSAAPGGCHHCGGPITCRSPTVTVSGREVRVCGDACRTAVETIAGAGGAAWYGLRTHADALGAVLDPRHQAELEAWRVPEVEATGVRTTAGGESVATLTVEDMRCAGCAWLVERLLTSIPGVHGAGADFALGRAEVRFDADTTRLPALLETLANAGYRAAPYTAGVEEAAIESERRVRIRSLGIASVFAMQVMLLSVSLYAGDYYGMEARFEALFRWLAMALTVPVLVWPGRAFFTGAFAALRARHLTMDVPVALGLSIAFLGSAWATITGEGAVWFDSVVMFVTLLCTARYLELLARRRATATIRALARSAPLVATRVSTGADAGERVPAAALRPGDRLRVRPGETLPADGLIRAGEAALDESLLTGESAPVTRSAGEKVLAGSANGPGVIEVKVTHAGDATALGGLLRRAEQAARERPEIARLADRIAAWFIAGVLLLAAGVALWWLFHDPGRMVPVLVSVLVVTCPCALSLATPAAMTAALGALARTGLIVTRADTIERLALVTHCLADKTGTLTEGRFRLRSVSALAGLSETRCLRLAAALEHHATHPVGAAIVAVAGGVWPEAEGCASQAGGARSEADGDEYEVETVTAQTGGVAGRIGDVLHAVGSADFVARTCALTTPDAPDGETDEGDTHVFLAREGVLLARFAFADALRAGAKELIEALRAGNIAATIASGDRPGAVDRAADALGVERRLAGLAPEDKLHEADRLAARGERVLMLGDGVNDTPALAGAHVSVAMGRRAAAAAARADMVLIGDDPRGLIVGVDIARRTRRIVKQNLAWAAGYNLVALPLAASGAVPPWGAAIGMSLSSLAVVGNALRLGRARARVC